MVPKMLELKLKCEWKIPGWRTTEQTFLLGEDVVCLRKGMSVCLACTELEGEANSLTSVKWDSAYPPTIGALNVNDFTVFQVGSK